MDMKRDYYEDVQFFTSGVVLTEYSAESQRVNKMTNDGARMTK